jgi:beta-lactamase regulating signal transducer with metallopeptidase domain
MRTAILYNFLLEVNLMAGIAIILMLILRKTLRKPLGNTALSFGWLLIAIRLLFPLSLPNPFIHLIRTPYVPDEALRPIAGQIKVRMLDFLGSMIGPGSSPAQDTVMSLHRSLSDASLPITLAKIYLLGVALVIAWFIFANVSFRQRLKADRIEPISGKLLSEYQALCQSLGFKKPLSVYLIDPLPSACLVGVFRPYIALPLTVTPQDALHVLRHEICHFQNRDHLWGVLRLLCCALHWFNPLVWLAAAISYTDSELRCDDRVTAFLATPLEKEAYANVLVLSAARRTAPGLTVLATGMTTTTKKLKARVLAILGNKKPLRWLSLAFMVVSTMLLAGAFATSEAPLRPRLIHFSPAVEAQNITSDEAAFTYAKELLARAEMGITPIRDDLNWETMGFGENPGEYNVGGNLPNEDRGLYSAAFDKEGRVTFLGNFDSDVDNSLPVNVSVPQKEQEALAEDLIRFLRLINPEEAVKANHWTLFSQEKGLTTTQLTYLFYDRESDLRSDGGTVIGITVQIAPVVRVLRVNFNAPNLGGENG